MPYSYYNFTRNDIFVNTLTLFPQVKFLVYSGSAFYNDNPDMSGSFTSSVNLCSASNISLFELNVDRKEETTGRTIGSVDNNGLIYPFIIKDGLRLNFRTGTTASFLNTAFGDPITGAAYPYTASISKEFYGPWTNDSWYPAGAVTAGETPRFIYSYLDPVTNINITGNVSHLLALKNSINDYKVNSPHFEYSSSTTSINLGISNRDFQSSSVGLLSIPSIFYGSAIKRGSITLEFYFTGTLIARAEDKLRNGELIETYNNTEVRAGSSSAYDAADLTTLSGSVVGLVLYEQGVILLTSSAALNTSVDNYTGSTADNPRWTYFAQSISPTAAPVFPPTDSPMSLPVFPGWSNMPSSSFIIDMSGTTETQVITMFATAPKGELNHSNNPSYLQNSWYTSSYTASVSSDGSGYLELDRKPIKNVVSSAYNDPTGSFEKTTYISKVGIYDAQRNLIGIAKSATPIRKTIERDFTFKMKLDI
jgi:hypothetical protein